MYFFYYLKPSNKENFQNYKSRSLKMLTVSKLAGHCHSVFFNPHYSKAGKVKAMK